MCATIVNHLNLKYVLHHMKLISMKIIDRKKNHNKNGKEEIK